MKNTRWIAVAIVAFVVLGGLYWWQGSRGDMTAADCTSYEQYDEQNGECYFECDTESQCSAIAAKVDAELNGYFEGSQSKITPTKPKTQLPTQPEQPSQVPTPPTPQDSSTKQLSLDDTGSETRGTLYTVTPNQELAPTPSAQDAELWQLFTRVASKQTIGERLLSFEVFSDGNNGSAASVWQSEQDPAKWHMNVNAAFMDDKKDLIHTMVHEFGHIVTLNTTQVERAGGVCPRFEIPEGCTKSGSYLATFEARFWQKYGANAPANYGENQDEVMQFYQGKENAFVTDYAASNPVEDLAETWAYFVLRARPADTSEKSQKILSLYDYPELVQQRDRIRANLGNELSQRNLLKR